MDCFDLLSSEPFHVILHQDLKHGLIFNRLDGTVSTVNHDDAKELHNLRLVGRVHGIVGHYLDKYLVLIKDRSLVGSFYDPVTKTDHEIYVITQVQVITVAPITQSATTISSRTSNSNNQSIRYDAEYSKQNAREDMTSLGTIRDNEEEFSSLPVTINTSSYNSSRSRANNWNPFKLAHSFKHKMPAQILRTAINDVNTAISDSLETGTNQSTSHQDESDKRLIEEMVKLFNNTESFYYSPTLDLTNRFSRKTPVPRDKNDNQILWKTADDRFFWNKYMLKILIELSERQPAANNFIRVILQGFVAINCQNVPVRNLDVETSLSQVISVVENKSSDRRSKSNNCQLALISRRSVFHAGTRYRRRGCDEYGNCANFVETEQILSFKKHFKSIVITRGSIPLFWYQTGYNYRPPPVFYKSDTENSEAFRKHFLNMMKIYETEQVITIDCTEQSGREKNLHDAYRDQIEKLRKDYPKIIHIEFDFHKHCRGRQCSDLQVEHNLRNCGLTDELMKDNRYYWNDEEVVWYQGGIFRVNCLDCTDRTNVVQRAIALRILDMQLSRLGLISPDSNMEDNRFKKIMQIMWSANGNVLSTQYCGTKALFTGERKLTGYLKDTYSSASRYYISKFRDVYRQAAIDAMLGVEPVNLTLSPTNKTAQDGNYELVNVDSIFGSRSGNAILKDVGSKVSDHLTKFKDRFQIKPTNSDDIRMSYGDLNDSNYKPELSNMNETLEGLNIDWPSSESVSTNDHQRNNMFNQLSEVDDSFQDDEFAHLMLSIDLSELQKLRGEDQVSDVPEKDKKPTKHEEIKMTEACGIITHSTDTTNISTSTTST